MITEMKTQAISGANTKATDRAKGSSGAIIGCVDRFFDVGGSVRQADGIFSRLLIPSEFVLETSLVFLTTSTDATRDE